MRKCPRIRKQTVCSRKQRLPLCLEQELVQGHSEGQKGHLGIRLLGFYLVSDRILKQKSIRINIVFREKTMAVCIKWTKEGVMGSRKKQV